MLADRLGLPVTLEHDAKAAALGEYHYGAGRGERDMVYIVVGTGVGSALILDGKVHRGRNNSAGEVGHITIRTTGDVCSCGNVGCVESFTAGPAIARTYRRALAATGDPERAESIQAITTERIVERARGGEALATQVLADAGEALGTAVATLAMILDVELYVIGSSVAKAGDLLLEPARRAVVHHAYRSVATRAVSSDRSWRMTARSWAVVGWRDRGRSVHEPLMAFPPEAWVSTQPDARAVRIKARLRQNERRIDVERARYTTRSYQATEGEPMPIRRAKMLLHLVRQMSITIDARRADRRQPLAPAAHGRHRARRRRGLGGSRAGHPADPAAGSFQHHAGGHPRLRTEIFPYWRGKTLEDIVAARVPEDVRKAVHGKAFSLNQTDHAQGHILPDVEGWLRLGIGGLRAQVQAARPQPLAPDDPLSSVVRRPAAFSRHIFYDAALIALQAAAEFMRATPTWPSRWPLKRQTRHAVPS